MIVSLQWLIPILVLIIAFLYSSVGFGGATSYLAILSLFAISPLITSTTALTLNVLVAGIAFINYFRFGHFKWRLVWPFLITSVPAALVGGLLKVNQSVYLLLLHVVVLYLGLRMLFSSELVKCKEVDIPDSRISLALLTGALIGFISGVVGIGGGIFLSPIILLACWGTPKQAASASAIFIVINSISGLVGRGLSGRLEYGLLGLVLIPSGLIGGLLGSYWGAKYLSNRAVQRLLGVVLLIVVTRYVISLF
jgi:uncharacterized membrane protein YfcA